MSRRHGPKLITQASIGRPRMVRIDARELYNKAIDFHRTGNLQGALLIYRELLRKIGREHPITVRVTFLTSLCCYQLRIYDEAIWLMELCRAVEFRNPLVHYNLGIIYDAAGRREDAAEAYRIATLLDPENKAATNNLGNVLRHLGDIEGAERCYSQVLDAVTEDPQARYNRSHVKLVRGDLAGGFADYEYRWKCDGWLAEYGRAGLTAPKWDATRAPERVFIWAEQGFGDALQFMRYVPLLTAMGHQVTVEADAPLVPLLEQLQHDSLRIVPRGKEPPPHDSQIPLLSLPAAFGTTLETIPKALQLRATKPCPVPLVRGFRAGIAWAGNPNHHNDRQRSAPLAELEPLFDVAGVTWYNLQLPPRGGEFCLNLHARKTQVTVPLDGQVRLRDISAYLRSFADTAAIMAELDLVVSVDTSVAHLAATMSVPTWVMLPYVPEWRWLEAREDSPWYPSVRLCRQPVAGAWHALAERMHNELALSPILHMRSA